MTEVTIVSPEKPTKQVRGKVLDEEGKPLANVVVKVRGRGNANTRGESPLVYHDQKTDENGTLTFTVWEPGRYDLTIFVDGFEPARVEGVIVGDQKVAPEFVAKMKRTKVAEIKADIEVQVVGVDKKPMSRVWVVPVKKQGEDPFEWDWQFERGQFTDKNGKTVFVGLSAGDYFFVGVPPSDKLPVAHSDSVSVTKTGKVKVLVAFPPVGRIVGKLVDEKGNPIAGEAVGIWAMEEGEWLGFRPYSETAFTRGDGSFEFEGVPENTYTFVTSFGFPSGLVTTGQSAFVKGGETVKVKVVVRTSEPTISIAGEVVDNKGNPVKGAAVLVNHEPMLKTFTDDNGRFAFNNLPVFRYGQPATYSVTVINQGFAMRSETVKAEIGKKAEVRLMLEPGGVIEGQLVNEKGEPVGGMPVHAVPLELACAG